MKEFKTCSYCGEIWSTRDNFLEDPDIELIGYQVNFVSLEYGMFMFNHIGADCGTTLAIYANEFLDLYSGERYNGNKAGSEGCPRYCLIEDQLDRCDVICECAFVREVLHKIKEEE